MTSPMPESHQDIIATAFKWRTLLSDDLATDEDRAAFAAWLAVDPRHQAAYEQADFFWGELGGLGVDNLDPEFFRPSWRERVRAACRRAGQAIDDCVPGPPSRFALQAGSLCLFLALTVFAVFGKLPQSAPQPYVSAAPIGQLRAVETEDGSRITLGADTSVAVTFTEQERHVLMSAGEAFFQVVSDRTRPFVVVSGDVRVTVHGTAFDVRSTDLGTRVSVSEGLVSVDYLAAQRGKTSDADAHRLSRPTNQESMVLAAGETVTVQKHSGFGMIAHIRPESVAPWRNNFLVYIDAPLAELINDINRYRPRKIRIADADIAALTVTATFDSHDIDAMLHSLTQVFPIRLKHTPHESVLHRHP